MPNLHVDQDEHDCQLAGKHDDIPQEHVFFIASVEKAVLSANLVAVQVAAPATRSINNLLSSMYKFDSRAWSRSEDISNKSVRRHFRVARGDFCRLKTLIQSVGPPPQK